MNRCEHCEHCKDTFGNYVECVLLHRSIDYEYWNNTPVDDCPLENEQRKE